MAGVGLDIRELRSFIQVARAGSVSRAATELHIAQPALSRQIAKLEAEIGAQLLIRYGRGVRLTAAGVSLLERAEMIAQMVSETGELVRASTDEERGHLALGLPPALAQLVGVPLIQAFKARWPGVSLHVREGLSSSLQEWVLDRRVDLALVYNQPRLEAVDVQPLFSEPLVLVGPPDSRVPASLEIRDLAGIPLILPGMPHSNRLLIGQAALQHGVRLRVEFEVDSVALTKAMVKAGLGYSILAYAAIRHEIASGALLAHSIERPALQSTVAITSLRERRAERLIAGVASLLSAQMRALVTGTSWEGKVIWLDRGSD